MSTISFVEITFVSSGRSDGGVVVRKVVGLSPGHSRPPRVELENDLHPEEVSLMLPAFIWSLVDRRTSSCPNGTSWHIRPLYH